MNSINVFNKHFLELHSNFIQEFIDKLKVTLPEQFHTIMDEQLKTDKEQIKLNIKNINKKNKKINNQDTPKKPAKANCWRLFCAHKSKEFPDHVSQNEKWGLASEEWALLKLNGGDKYWKDLADKLNSEQADSSPVLSNEDTPVEEDNKDSQEEPETPPTPTKAAPKKAAPKKAAPKKAAPKKAAPKKAAPIIQDVLMDSDDEQNEHEDDFIVVNQDNNNNMVTEITV